MNEKDLAINGGAPLRAKPFPGRRLMGPEELESVKRVFEDGWAQDRDPGYQGKYEEEYAKAFCGLQGGAGFADAVSSGSAAVFVSLAALDLPRGSDVIFSPLTDPGAVSSAIIQGHRVVVADARPGGFNIGPEQFEAALTPNARAAVITHVGGVPAAIDEIASIARKRGIRLVEDCSQAHGALHKGTRVGCFGDIAAFSTMFSKNHATGGCGGVVYTRDQALYWRARGAADRGKPFHLPEADVLDPRQSLFPALNFNQSEFACAIGLSTLAKLPATMSRRREIILRIDEKLRASRAVKPMALPANAVLSPFFHTLVVDETALTVSKAEFARAVMAEGARLNPDYPTVVVEWPWAKPYLREGSSSPNAISFRNSAVNILFTERFSDADADDVAACFLKVESVFARR